MRTPHFVVLAAVAMLNSLVACEPDRHEKVGVSDETAIKAVIDELTDAYVALYFPGYRLLVPVVLHCDKPSPV